MTVDSGFDIVPAVFSTEEVVELASQLARHHLRGRAGSRHLMQSSAVAELANERRLRSLATEALGVLAVPYRATLFEKSTASNWLVVWHQDTALPLQSRFEAPGWGPWSIKAGITYSHAPAESLERIVALRLHLDDSTLDNGPLRIIPGSHRFGVLSDEAIGSKVRTLPHLSCVVPAGGVLVMRPLHIHASSKSTSSARRRVLHLEYADTLNFGGGAVLAVA
jgi:hypothetical protein